MIMKVYYLELFAESNCVKDQTTRRTKKVEVESRDTSKAKTQIALAQKRIESVKVRLVLIILRALHVILT